MSGFESMLLGRDEMDQSVVNMHTPSQGTRRIRANSSSWRQISMLLMIKAMERSYKLEMSKLVGMKRLHDDLEVTATKFNSIKDAKSLLQAVEKRFGGNAATKKTQRNLLKQHQQTVHNLTMRTAANHPKCLEECINVADGYTNNELQEFLKNTGIIFHVNVLEDIGFDNPRKATLGFMRPFGCPDTILNTIDHLGKFNGTKACDDAGKARMESVLGKDYILLPLWTTDPPFSQISKSSPDAGFKPSSDDRKKDDEDSRNSEGIDQEKEDNVNNNNNVNSANTNEVTGIYDDEDVGAEADMNNLDAFMFVSPILTTRVHKDHLVEQIIGDLNSIEPKKVTQALQDPSWIEAMQDELLQFKLQKVWTLVDLPNGKRPMGTKWVFRNKKDERGIMDVKSDFLYAKIEEEDYVCQPPGFEDPDFPDIMISFFGSTKKSLCTEFEKMMHKKFQMSYMGELTFFLGLQVKQKVDRIFISQDNYVTEILKKFSFTDVKTTSTPMETQKLLLKDEDGEEVDVHLYRSMIGSLMYLTSSRPDIMFAVCACARYQVNPKVSHLHAVKRIFRYLKGQPKLGLWYPKDLPFDLVAYTDSDYVGASLDRKSTIGGCQFLRCRLISWQCKKQTVVANSTTEAEYVAASSCCGQVLWIQNQLLDYGYNFMHTKIFIDNNSTICIIKNPVFHSKTKHIEIRHHFIMDYNEKKLIQMVKIHTDKNVADLLTKAFDVSRFQYLIASIGMLNL
ncbi:putative ribonuclease H-like domain-containing protein [Tanacetum coccineum]